MATDWNKYQRDYRNRHPEQLIKWKINSAIKLLQAHGYTVKEPAQDQEKQKEGVTD